MKEDKHISKYWREAVISDFIDAGLRNRTVFEFTLQECVELCYPKGAKRPRDVGRCTASTLRAMLAKSKPGRTLVRNSRIGRGHKGVYIAKGKGWTQ